jgi:hypothetical protein
MRKPRKGNGNMPSNNADRKSGVASVHIPQTHLAEGPESRHFNTPAARTPLSYAAALASNAGPAHGSRRPSGAPKGSILVPEAPRIERVTPDLPAIGGMEPPAQPSVLRVPVERTISSSPSDNSEKGSREMGAATQNINDSISPVAQNISVQTQKTRTKPKMSAEFAERRRKQFEEFRKFSEALTSTAFKGADATTVTKTDQGDQQGSRSTSPQLASLSTALAPPGFGFKVPPRLSYMPYYSNFYGFPDLDWDEDDPDREPPQSIIWLGTVREHCWIECTGVHWDFDGWASTLFKHFNKISPPVWIASTKYNTKWFSKGTLFINFASQTEGNLSRNC